MGDFMGHVVPGTLLLLVGLWRVWSSVARFAAADTPASSFRVRAWNPVPNPALPRLLELHVIAGGAVLDMCVELVYASPLRAVLPGGGGVDDHAARLGGVEHAGMLLMFFLFGALALVSEKTRYLPLPDAALGMAFATAFTAEFILFRFHSSTHAGGLEAYYHGHLLLLLALCVAAVVAGALLLPASFPADLGAGVLVAVQGMWFYQTALTLYGPMLPAGCARRFDTPRSDARVECLGCGAALERAEMLADFQLFGIVFVVFVYVIGCYAVAAARFGKSNRQLTTTVTARHHEHAVAATAMEE